MPVEGTGVDLRGATLVRRKLALAAFAGLMTEEEDNGFLPDILRPWGFLYLLGSGQYYYGRRFAPSTGSLMAS